MKPIPDFPNYFATEDGRIFSDRKWKTGGKLKELTQKTCKTHQYKFVRLCKNGKHFYRLTHRVILETFVGPCPRGYQGAHGIKGKHCNSLDNLAWKPASENNYEDKMRDGTDPRGQRNGMSKLTARDVYFIRFARAAGASRSQLAKSFGIGEAHINQLTAYRRWKHL